MSSNTPNLHRASFEATYLNTAGKPSDIMIYENGIVRWQPRLLRRPRNVAQLKVEAGTILAHGCRVNLWHDPLPDGSIADDKAGSDAQIAAFVRERQDWCIDIDSLAEVAILASYADHCLDPHRQDKVVRAAHQLLQEAHIPCHVLREDTLLARLQNYRAVVLPEISQMDLDTAQWLHQFAMDGGASCSSRPTAGGNATLARRVVRAAGRHCPIQPGRAAQEWERVIWQDRLS